MSTPSEWRDLARRCGESTGEDREIDLALARTIDAVVVRQETGCAQWEYTYWHFTRLIDDAVSLIEKTLPGWAWKVGTCTVSDDAWLVPDFNHPVHGARLLEQFGPIKSGLIWDDGIDVDRRPPGHVALALCEVYCEVRAAIEEAARVNGAAAERSGE